MQPLSKTGGLHDEEKRTINRGPEQSCRLAAEQPVFNLFCGIFSDPVDLGGMAVHDGLESDVAEQNVCRLGQF